MDAEKILKEIIQTTYLIAETGACNIDKTQIWDIATKIFLDEREQRRHNEKIDHEWTMYNK